LRIADCGFDCGLDRKLIHNPNRNPQYTIRNAEFC
jgi:hypothetical protein